MKPRSAWKRRTIASLKWIGLLVCAGLLATWIVAGRYGRTWRFDGSDGSVTDLTLGRGCLRCDYYPKFFATLANYRVNRFEWNRYPWDFDLWIFMDPNAHRRIVSLPLWMPLVLAALPTAYLWRRHTILSRRERIGLCPKCRYDRRGLDPAAPCPECGKSLTHTRSVEQLARIRRVTLGIAASTSALLIVTWLGSAWWECTWSPRDGYMVLIDQGQLHLVKYDERARRFTFRRRIDVLPPHKIQKRELGWSFNWFPLPSGGCLVIPLWAPVVLCGGVAGASWWREGAARKRKRLQQCLGCGYDRRGLDPAAACPECGR